MTRAFRETIHCPHCGAEITNETAFSRWIRRYPELASEEGYGLADQDLVWHKFRIKQSRDFQLMMDIEVKTHGADLTLSQRDTLLIRHQLIANRYETPTKKTRWQAGHTVRWVFSAILGRKTWVRHFGVHVLRLENTAPNDSEWIEWDKKRIDEATLVSILKFDLDPDTLQPMDYRSHHRSKYPGSNAMLSGVRWETYEDTAS